MSTGSSAPTTPANPPSSDPSSERDPNLCEQCCIRAYSFCEPLDDTGLKALADITGKLTLKASQILAEEGTPVVSNYTLLQGTMRQIKLMPDGRRQIIGFLHPGDFIGLSHGTRFSHTVEAVTDAFLCTFPKDQLTALMHRTPVLEHKFLEIATRELATEEEHALLLGRKTSRERVAFFLKDMAQMAERYHRADNPLHLPMTRGDIADYLGLTVETVSRTLTAFKKEGLISFDEAHIITLKDPDAIDHLQAGRA